MIGVFPHHLTKTVSFDQATQLSLTPFEYENQIGRDNSHCVIEQDEANKDSNSFTSLRILSFNVCLISRSFSPLYAGCNDCNKEVGNKYFTVNTKEKDTFNTNTYYHFHDLP